MNKPRNAHESGFTLIEMMTTLIIMVIVLSIAIPSFVVWLPNYRLSSAARDLFSNMQQAKMGAIQANGTYKIVFFNPDAQSYIIQDNTGATIKTVNFVNYGSNITYGNGSATNSYDGAAFGDFVSYVSDASSNDNEAAFTSRGLAKTGYVYLANEKNTAYVVGSQSSGVIMMRKWINGDWQ